MGDIEIPPQKDKEVDFQSDEYLSEDLRDISWVKNNVPCQTACPASTNIPGYIRQIYLEDFGGSYETNRYDNILPGVLGRICSRPCEDQCRHGWPGNGEPVAICHLKRVASDNKSINHRISERLYAPTGKKIAVVGAGPAGIAITHDLSLFGHDVSIFEKEKQPGGMLQYGIPEFRLPRDVLQTEINNALRLGAKLYTNKSIGNGEGEISLSQLQEEFDAIVLTVGTTKAADLPLSGEWKNQDIKKIKGIEYGLNFLVDIHRGVKKEIGEKVIVIGAGFSALDCARIATRIGGKFVSIHIRTTEEYIPVTKDEIYEAKREGIDIKGLRTPIGLQVNKSNRVTGVVFAQNRLGAFREGGRRQAIPIKGSEFIEKCDSVIIAIGQVSDSNLIEQSLDVDKWGNAKINQSGFTSIDKVFAAGDFVNGADTVISAIGHAREIARKVDSWIMNKERLKKIVKISPVEKPLRERAFDFIPRKHMPTIAPEQRKVFNLEVETGYAQEDFVEEAKRCYLCNLRYQIDTDVCIYCRACIEVAPRNCIKLVGDVVQSSDSLSPELVEETEWNKVAAIWIDNDECIRCGNCVKACPVDCIHISRCDLTEVEIK